MSLHESNVELYWTTRKVPRNANSSVAHNDHISLALHERRTAQ